MIKLEELQKLLPQRKSKSFYAKRLDISIEEVEQLLEESRQQSNPEKISEYKWSSDNTGNVFKHNVDKGEIEIQAHYKTPPTTDQVIKDHKIDTTKFKLSSYWSKGQSKGWLVSALFSQIPQEAVQLNSFQDFLSTYKSTHIPIVKEERLMVYNEACLVINKQDSHLNKFDINGDNDIQNRFDKFFQKTKNVLNKTRIACTLEKIIYVIGSDQFNSEWNNTTVKGTPQTNILPYHTGFQAICDHETKIIDMLLKYSTVEVIYIPGNHDATVGFHMISWLKAYYRNQSNLDIDITIDFTKYRKYSNTALCFNHGDVQKPEKLAQNFPIEFKEHWSTCDHYYVMTGDKHCELSKSIGGIKFYQIPALSTAKSTWDSQCGYTTTKAELTAFLIEKGQGMTDIYKQSY